MASQSMEIMAKVLEQQVLQSARMVEEQLDAELGKLERMDDDEMEKLKERRMEALKKSQKQKQVGGKDRVVTLAEPYGGCQTSILFSPSSYFIPVTLIMACLCSVPSGVAG